MKKKNTINISYILHDTLSQWQKYHEKTKWRKLTKFLAVKDWPTPWKTTYFKEYPRMDKIVLPKPQEFVYNDFKNVLLFRHSTRKFGKTPLTLEQISSLLFYSAGMKSNESPWIANRTYASPGGRYALEVYMMSLNSDLPMGIYHYNLKQHSLEILEQLDLDTNDYFNQDWIKTAGCVVFFTGVFARNTIKYGQRGYRHVLQEAGHLGQNVYLTATALNLNVCAVGGYAEPKIDALLDIDGLDETVIYVITLGNKT